MKTKEKTVRRVVGVLEGAQPQLVSLVNHAGNQTPFQHVRNEDGTEAQVRTRTRGAMPKAVLVRSISFDGAQFPSVEAVSEYMDGHGFADFAVAKRSGGFTVEASTDELVDVSEITLAPGVVATVGKKAPDAAVTPGATATTEARSAAFEAQKAKRRADLVTHLRSEGVGATSIADIVSVFDRDYGAANWQVHAEPATPVFATRADAVADIEKRYSDWGAYDYASYYNPEAITIADVMKGGADGLPPGYSEVLYAFNLAMKNALSQRNTSAVDALVSELGSYVKTLAATFPDATVPDPDIYSRAEGASDVTTQTTQTPAPAPAAVAAPAPAADQTRTDATAAADPAAAAVTAEPAAEAAPAPVAEPSIADSIARMAESIGKVSETLTSVVARLDKLENPEPAPAPAAAAEGTTETRAAEPAKPVPSRRSAEAAAPAADAVQTRAVDAETEKDRACMRRMDANRFGFAI